MRIDAEKDGRARLSSGKDDDRITPVGRFIRACRLDELPQLFNMSVTEWGRCITEVKKSLDAQMLANVAFTAIVQKENLNMTEMADILTKYPMKVFLYGQQCEAGNIIYAVRFSGRL